MASWPVAGIVFDMNQVVFSPHGAKESLLSKLDAGDAVIGVVGLGYVGVPFAGEKAKVGVRVIGVEQNPNRAAKVNRGENYIGDVKDDELRSLVTLGLLSEDVD